MFTTLLTKFKVLAVAGVTAGAVGIGTQSASARGWNFDFAYRPAYSAPVIVEQPAYVAAPAPVYVAPAPDCQPAPVIIYQAPRPVYYHPEYRRYEPFFHFGWGRR